MIGFNNIDRLNWKQLRNRCGLQLTGRKTTYAKPGYVNVTVALYFMTRMGTDKATTEEFFQLPGKKPKTFEEFAGEITEAFMN